jgi:DNA helicase-2/ATP-dependent DNA helicase PcrA
MSVGSASRTAEDWAEIAQAQLEQCIDDNKSFVLEAGAGAGKTFSLVYALKYIIEKNGPRLLRNGKQVACITYTNAATEEIASRIDRSPLVIVSTIHSLCWSLLSQFPSVLKKELPNLSHWPERLEESGGLNNRNVIYSLGYPSAKATDHVSLHHDDVLALMIRFLGDSSGSRG